MAAFHEGEEELFSARGDGLYPVLLLRSSYGGPLFVFPQLCWVVTKNQVWKIETRAAHRKLNRWRAPDLLF